MLRPGLRHLLPTIGVLLAMLASNAAAQCSHDAELTPTEITCQGGESVALAKFSKRKGTCVKRCLAELRPTANAGDPVDFGACLPPYTDAALLACLSAPDTGAEVKAEAEIVRKCSADTPECYGDLQTRAPARVGQIEALIDEDVPVVYCVEASNTDPSGAEARCEDTVAKASAKLVGAIAKILRRCRASECVGRVAPGGCEPGPGQDVAIFQSLDRQAARAAALIDGKCIDAGAKPPCMAFLGPGWAGHVLENANYFRTSYCGSPSGAFVE
jgi:hypothetical protein